jgi:cytochrome c oxidase subunit 3
MDPANDHEHGHHPALAHHFNDLEQQHSALKMGLWFFLVTEILLFGGLFGFYVFFRAWHPEMFVGAAKNLNMWLGGLNTLVLIASSVTVALAIRCIQLNQPKKTVIYLIATIACAAIFMVVKYFEYTHKFHAGLYPGANFANLDLPFKNPHVFFSIYFAMTGLHGLHVLGGMGFLTWVAWRTTKGAYSSEYYTPIELGGLYWHLVDLIWIYLFPLLYLI